MVHVAVVSDLVPETYTGAGQLHAPVDQVRPRPRPSASSALMPLETWTF